MMEVKTKFVKCSEEEIQRNVSDLVDNDESFNFVLREGSQEFLNTELQIMKAMLEQRMADMQHQKVQIEILKNKFNKIFDALKAKEGKDSDNGNNIQH